MLGLLSLGPGDAVIAQTDIVNIPGGVLGVGICSQRLQNRISLQTYRPDADLEL